MPRKRHGGRKANRGTPLSCYSVGQPTWIRGLVRKWRRRFGAAWYTSGARVTVEGGESAAACDIYDALAHDGRGMIASKKGPTS